MGAKKLVILLGSPRKKGNSAILASRVAAGARAAGAKVASFYLHGMDIHPCSACEGCSGSVADRCVIEDDMQAIYPKLCTADSILVASPVYWFTVSAQTKMFMDRCYALGGAEGNELAGKRIGIVLTYADPDPFTSGAVNALRTFQDGYNYIGARIEGMVYGSAYEAGEIKENREVMKKAYALGKKLA